MSKQIIIIDKSIFQGNCTEKLSNLAQKHIVILPHVFFEECMTTEGDRSPESLIKKAETAIKSGAFISLPRGRMIEIERETLQPLESIIDKTGTEQIRNKNIEDLQINFQEEALKLKKNIEPMIRFEKKIANAFWATLQDKDYSKNWRTSDEDNDTGIRLGKWTESLKEEPMRAWIAEIFPDMSSHIQNDWMTWHLLQLLIAYGIEWAYKRNSSGQSFGSNIINDVYDIEYVLCLARSDALVSNDRKLMVPLAQAIFPKKKIYHKLEDCE
jgi:hypothetical protein